MSDWGSDGVGVRLKYSCWFVRASLLLVLLLLQLVLIAVDAVLLVPFDGKWLMPMSVICLRLRMEFTSAGLILFMVSISSLWR